MPTTRAKFLLTVFLWGPAILCAQKTTPDPSQAKARQELAAAIRALGGEAWLHLKTIREKGKTGAYFQGNPTGLLAETTNTWELPGKERVDFAGKGRIVQIYTAHQGWEITYKGAKPIPADKLQDYLRWREHSLRTALQQWLPDPATVLLNEGPSQVERRPADKVTLIDRHNDAITLEIDAETHLPLRLSFLWRDPRFQQKNLDAVEYDNYRPVSGIATPFTITHARNGQIISQRYVLRVQYNVAVPADLFNPALEAKRKR